MSSTYRNRLNTFSASTEENQSGYEQYLAKKASAISSNKASVESAMDLAQAHLTGEFVKGATLEGSVRFGKPLIAKGLDFADRLGKDAGKGVFRVSNWIDNKAGIGKTAGSKISSAMSETKAPDINPLADAGEGGEGAGKLGADGMRSVMGLDGEITKMAPSIDPASLISTGETKTADSLITDGTDKLLTTGTDKLLTTGADLLAKTGLKQLASSTLETAGGALDATGVGAIVGIPLQIAGLALEGGALWGAGTSVVDWFKQDILGDKPPLVIPGGLSQAPTKFSTQTSSGFGATPTSDTTMDAPSGGGSW